MLNKTVGLSTLIVLATTVAILAITTDATSSQQPPTVEAWATGKSKNDKQEHHVGPLPWAAGQDPIRESYAENFPIRQWTNKDGSKAEAEMFYWFFPALKTQSQEPTSHHGGKKRTKRKESARGGRGGGGERNDDEGDIDDGDDTPGFDADDEEEKDGGGRFEELNAELERDQEEEAAFSATLPSSLPFDFKVAAASKRRRRRTKADNNADEDPDAMYTKSGYVKDQRAVVKDMMIFLDQFYERYPEQQKADLYIAGRSYAGKFIPSIAHVIMERNKKIQSKLPQSACGGVIETETAGEETIEIQATPKEVVIPIKGSQWAIQ